MEQSLDYLKKEIDQNFKSIVDFADLWEYIDQPVQTLFFWYVYALALPSPSMSTPKYC